MADGRQWETDLKPRLATSGIGGTDFRTRGYYAALALVLVLSLWLRAAFPIFAIGTAGHDDQLFVRLAASIGAGNWLGDYNNLTHAKGAAYSIFLLANHITGLPLKFSEHLLYLLAAFFFASLIGRLYNTRWATLATFALLAFIPTAWNPLVGGRVVREGLYVSLSLFLLALSVRCFVGQKAASVEAEVREKWPFLVLLGLVAGIYWLTREEGIWLLPSIAILLSFWIWSRRTMLRPWKLTVFFLFLPLIPALLVIGTVNSLNYFKYGVFRNNDFRSSDFQAGYGALSRIKHDQWQRYVVFPKDAREHAYRFSPAARELQPFFEGPGGEFWRNAGCTDMRITPCPEILSGWFMWALRDAVAAAGHYRSAQAASSFYQRLAAEIDTACDQHAGECLPHRQTMVPPWRGHYFVDTLRASWAVFETLLTMDDAPVGVVSSLGSPKQLAVFALVTNGPLVPPEQSPGGTFLKAPDLVSPWDRIRYEMVQSLAKAEIIITLFGAPAAIATWLAWLIIAVRRRRVCAGLVITSALVAALGTRVILLGFLDATSIPSNMMLYLSPVAPMALALIPTVLFGVVAFARKSD